MAEVNRVMEQINQRCANAPVIMGAAVDESFTDRLAVTLLASRRRDPARQTPESAELPDEGAVAPSKRGETDSGGQLLSPETTLRPNARVVAPAPELSREGTERLRAQQNSAMGRRHKGPAKLRQGQLQLEIVSKGRFDKSEPTIHKGEDLDLPTYVRRGVVLN
jgi:cell division protein FtsZ